MMGFMVTLIFFLRVDRPLVRAERAGWQAALGPQVEIGTASPAKPRGHRLGDLVAPDMAARSPWTIFCRQANRCPVARRPCLHNWLNVA